MTADDAPTAPRNLAVAEIRLRIIWRVDDIGMRRPEKWDFDQLLDLSPDESVEVLEYEELGSYEEIVDAAVSD